MTDLARWARFLRISISVQQKTGLGSGFCHTFYNENTTQIFTQQPMQQASLTRHHLTRYRVPFQSPVLVTRLGHAGDKPMPAEASSPGRNSSLSAFECHY